MGTYNNFSNNYRNNSFNGNNKGEYAMKNNCCNKFENFDVTNSAPRCPVTLLVDTSGSMYGQPIRELNAAIQQFVQDLKQDEVASASVELEIIRFDSSADIVTPYTAIQDLNHVPTLTANGYTSMGAGLNLATQELNARRRLYKSTGCSAYKPWVVLMTDGGPNDNWQQAASEMRRLGENQKIWYLGIEVGDCVDHNTMCQIMPLNSPPVKLDGLRFRDFFKWLSDSLKSVSSSAVSEENNVQFGAFDWADLSGM